MIILGYHRIRHLFLGNKHTKKIYIHLLIPQENEIIPIILLLEHNSMLIILPINTFCCKRLCLFYLFAVKLEVVPCTGY